MLSRLLTNPVLDRAQGLRFHQEGSTSAGRHARVTGFSRPIGEPITWLVDFAINSSLTLASAGNYSLLSFVDQEATPRQLDLRILTNTGPTAASLFAFCNGDGTNNSFSATAGTPMIPLTTGLAHQAMLCYDPTAQTLKGWLNGWQVLNGVGVSDAKLPQGPGTLYLASRSGTAQFGPFDILNVAVLPVRLSDGFAYNSARAGGGRLFERFVTDHGYSLWLPLNGSLTDRSPNARSAQLYVNTRGPYPLSITNISAAASAVITVSATHGLLTGQTVHISGITGAMSVVNGTHVLSAASGTSLTVPVNTTGLSYAGGGGQVTPFEFVAAPRYT